MFRKNLVNNNPYENIYIYNKWSTKIKGLIKTPFFDNNDFENGYVVYYSEIKQGYFIVKFNLKNGEIIFEKKVTNGSYGTGAIYKNQIISYKEFKDLVSFDKNTGEFLWELKTNTRIRSSVNILENQIIFSSGNYVYFVNELGKIQKKVKIDNAFLYGTISKIGNFYYVLGTKFSKEKKCSCLYLFSFEYSGIIISEKNIGKAEVISSDTSGLWITNNNILLACNDEIFLIDSSEFKIIWKQKVLGIASRHVVISDDKNVYYTTLKGRIGSIDLKTGNKVWEISTQESLIFSPPSIYGKTLFVLADCVVYLIDKTTGSVYFKKIIGHSPYSAPIIFNNNLFIGGGEPPLNGVLLSFDIKHSLNEIKNKEEVLKVIEFGNYVENNKMQISIIFEKKVKNVYLDVSVISNDNIIKPIDIKENNYIFEFNLKKITLVDCILFQLHLKKKILKNQK